jgi:transcriptional regulator with XRE-family HTH domain
LQAEAENPAGKIKFSGRRLRALRKAHRLTQVEFADAIGVHPSALGMWELGKGGRVPDGKTIARICMVVHCTPSQLFDLPGRR